jgi:uncharacterized membrane protein
MSNLFFNFRSSSFRFGLFKNTIFLGSLAILCLLAVLPAAAQGPVETPPKYKFIGLSAPFPGVDQTLAYGVNNFGTVVGDYHDTTGSHGFVFQDGKYTSFNVPFPEGEDTAAFAINNFRHIVGSYTSNGITHGFLLKDGAFTSFDFPGSGVISTAPRGINDRDQIVGAYNDATGSHGFLYERGHFIDESVPFQGACCTEALGINDRGEIVGAYAGGDNVVSAFEARDGRFRTIDTPFPNNQAQACAINNRREIVGTGFLLERGKLTLLSALSPQTANAVGFGINDRGEIVGIVLQPDSSEQGFILKPD